MTNHQQKAFFRSGIQPKQTGLAKQIDKNGTQNLSIIFSAQSIRSINATCMASSLFVLLFSAVLFKSTNMLKCPLGSYIGLYRSMLFTTTLSTLKNCRQQSICIQLVLFQVHVPCVTLHPAGGHRRPAGDPTILTFIL